MHSTEAIPTFPDLVNNSEGLLPLPAWLMKPLKSPLSLDLSSPEKITFSNSDLEVLNMGKDTSRKQKEELIESPYIATEQLPCKRCLYIKRARLGVRRVRRFCLENVKNAPRTQEIIGYSCDVGMKSLLRMVCDFYSQRLRNYQKMIGGKVLPDGAII
jgi:hypothetical protein